ncbi:MULTISPECIES: chloride channel protein [unclassified Wenzhouxiangella]|uniref:chloride channel protein n=1 Tax=unclassified Wenzhouxiangella TaxID=2613841 RepID=UPI0021619391|nr:MULTISPECIES: chloride channel protein [unclassified Wenzhouxiangella]
MSDSAESPTGHQDPGDVLRRVSLVVLLGALAGMVSAILANGFVAAIGWLNDLLLISPRSRMMEEDAWLVTLAIIIVPTAGGLVGGILHRFIPDRRPHSPADLIAAVQTRKGRLPLRTGLLTGLSSLVSLGSGASVGQYGPLVHVGGSVGSGLARLFRAGVTSDNIAIACGVAAAISTVFHAPIAGILFAHEVVLRHFALRAFAPVAVASVLGHVTAQLIWPQPPLFQVAEAEVAHLWEFGLFVVLGMASAGVAVAYMSALLRMARIAGSMKVPSMLRPALAGLGLGLTALWVPDILGMGSETLRLAFIEGAFTQWELLLVMVLKLLATAWCLGMGFAGGVFSPALVIGSLFGALFGSVIGSLLGLDLSALVVYAVCGMVAVTAPVIGAPLTTVIIVFEMTASYPLTIAALASVALANLVASRYFGRSLFDRQLTERGHDLSGGRSRAILRTHTLGELLSDDYVTVSPDARAGEAREAIVNAGSAEAYLVDARSHYVGTVHLHELVAAGDDEPAQRWCDSNALCMREDETVWDAMNAMRHFVGEGVAVLDKDGRLVGTVFESDLINAYLELLERMRKEEHATA